MIAVNVAAALTGLVLMLAASELMVRQLFSVGESVGGFPDSILGFLVALAADAPEISTAIVALIGGSQAIGIGVVEGSNIYNLAGLLGLSALVAGPLLVDKVHLMREGSVNIAVTGVIVALVIASGLVRVPLALLAITVSIVFFLVHASGARHPRSDRSALLPLVLAFGLTLILIGMSFLLVHSVEALIRELHLPTASISLVALPIATSLPNTWAAVSLARRGMATAAISTAFSSNLINLSIGVGLLSLFINIRAVHLAAVFDGPFLLGMTTVTVVLLATAGRLGHLEGIVIVSMYVVFLVLRLGVLGH